jgi:hypothetical protein
MVWFASHSIHDTSIMRFGDCVSMNEELHHIEGTFALGVKDSSVESPNAMR